MFPGQAAGQLRVESVPFRMKILDIPQSGKKGLDVSMGGRYGQVRRSLVRGMPALSKALPCRRSLLARVCLFHA